MHDDVLTKRELQVVTLVSKGLSNAKISDTLGISEKTVKKHLENIFRKLGVDCRTAASAWFFRVYGVDGKIGG